MPTPQRSARGHQAQSPQMTQESPVRRVHIPPQGTLEITLSLSTKPVPGRNVNEDSSEVVLKDVSLSTRDSDDRRLQHVEVLPLDVSVCSSTESLRSDNRSNREPIGAFGPGGKRRPLKSMAASKCIKWSVFAFNFIIFVVGCTLAGLALWLRFSEDFREYMGNVLDKVPQLLQLTDMFIFLYVVAAIGGLLALCGFLGCCGACCESRCLLGTFFFCMLVLFIACVAGAIYVLVKRDDFNDMVMQAWKKVAVDMYNTDESTRKWVDAFHLKHKCCGAYGCDDYGSRPPESCQCHNKPRGCGYVLVDLMNSNSYIIAGVLFGSLALELLAMLFSCILYQGIGRYN